MSKQAKGNGTLRKRSDGRWEGRYSLGRDPATGKQIQKSVYGKTQSEVRKKLQTICVDIDTGSHTEPSKMTVKQWFGIWIAEYTSHLKYRSLELYKGHISKRIIPSLGYERLSTLQAYQIQAFYNNLSSDGLSSSLVRTIHSILHTAIEQAVELNYIKINPTKRCKLPKLERPNIKPLMGDNLKMFLGAIHGHQFETLFMVDLFTGMREGEILGLTWDSIDFNNHSITLSRQLQRINGIRVLTTLKNDKSRVIEPAVTVMDLLREQKKTQTINRLKAGSIWNNKLDLVFTNEIGESLCHNTVYRNYKIVVASIGLPSTRFHDLRHSYAVIALQSGDNIKTVQETLGHHSAAFTLDVYGHVSDDMRKESAKKIENFIQNISV